MNVRERRRGRLAAGIGVVLVAVFSARGYARPGQQADADEAARLVRGTIDIHVHSGPDTVERALDGIDAAKFARAKGMRAIVLKNHLDPTGQMAVLARKEAPGLEVYGGVDLNLPVGGMNPAAVEHMTELLGSPGRMVWMSTNDAEFVVRTAKSNRPFVSVARDGALLPETKAVIAVIAKHGLAMATGHTSALEALMLIREARAQGVNHIVVTHAINMPAPGMSIAQMKEAASLGAFLEFTGGPSTSPADQAKLDRFAAAIRQVGPQFCILSSDLGQKGSILPADGFAATLVELKKRGFSEDELAAMSRRNPAQLLGLPAQP
ncbi:MAG: DUF6282 family protein [Acidobacteriota bacterium]